jgi:hypothetical protein
LHVVSLLQYAVEINISKYINKDMLTIATTTSLKDTWTKMNILKNIAGVNKTIMTRHSFQPWLRARRTEAVKKWEGGQV